MYVAVGRDLRLGTSESRIWIYLIPLRSLPPAPSIHPPLLPLPPSLLLPFPGSNRGAVRSDIRMYFEIWFKSPRTLSRRFTGWFIKRATTEITACMQIIPLPAEIARIFFSNFSRRTLSRRTIGTFERGENKSQKRQKVRRVRIYMYTVQINAEIAKTIERYRRLQLSTKTLFD